VFFSQINPVLNKERAAARLEAELAAQRVAEAPQRWSEFVAAGGLSSTQGEVTGRGSAGDTSESDWVREITCTKSYHSSHV
jgi:hypothetical protein